ncbi:MAG: thioredoxin family protein [Flavobacteriaceae bacterium]
MAKFGEIVDEQRPVLIDFYFELQDELEDQEILRDVAAALGDRAKVVKIDIEKNQELANALKVKANPTFMIYKSGEMKWRKTGTLEANALISTVEQYC